VLVRPRIHGSQFGIRRLVAVAFNRRSAKTFRRSSQTRRAHERLVTRMRLAQRDHEIAYADAATRVIPLIYFFATDASRSAHARPTPQFVSFAPGKPVQPPFSRKLPRS
jgi:hypothetical protein